MTTAPALPGTLADLLTVGLVVTMHTDWLHFEHDPAVFRPPGGIVHTVGGDGYIGTVAVGLRGRPDGMALDRFHAQYIHDCPRPDCLYRPVMARPADVRYAARWCLRTVGRGHGRLSDHDRRLVGIAVALLTKGDL